MTQVPSATRVVAYLPSLKTILQRLRATSATPSSLNSTLLVSTSYSATPVTVWTTSSFEHHLRDHTAHSSAISSESNLGHFQTWAVVKPGLLSNLGRCQTWAVVKPGPLSNLGRCQTWAVVKPRPLSNLGRCRCQT